MDTRTAACIQEGREVVAADSRPGRPVEEILRRKTARERWLILMKLVRREHPHGIMYGVNIADGIIVSCDKLQPCLSLDPAAAQQDGGEPAFDANWQRLEALCKRIGTGRLTELRFGDGRPVAVLPLARGWRFGHRLS